MLSQTPHPRAKGRKPLFTYREIEILEQLSNDFSVKMIAGKIGISEYTVQDYIKRLKERLKLHTAAGIVAKCLRDGIIR